MSGLVPSQWRLEARADQMGAEYPKDTQTVVDAQVTLEGNRKLQVLSGNAQVRRAAYTRDLTLEELITTGGPFQPDFLETGPGGSGGPSGLPTVLDIHITADNTLIVKNNLADAVGSAYINLRGTTDTPQASGRILLTRGTLNFRNGRYDLTRALITIPGRRGAEPTIDFQAEVGHSRLSHLNKLQRNDRQTTNQRKIGSRIARTRHHFIDPDGQHIERRRSIDHRRTGANRIGAGSVDSFGFAVRATRARHAAIVWPEPLLHRSVAGRARQRPDGEDYNRPTYSKGLDRHLFAEPHLWRVGNRSRVAGRVSVEQSILGGRDSQ